jgi:4-amino-4-deoxy-L-arabinose transferase-like glycosyltransferase
MTQRAMLFKWGLLGVVVGVGWWVNGLIIVYAVPVGLLLAYRLLRLRRINGLALVAIATFGYFVGSAPWWVYNLEHEWAALAFYMPSLSAADDVHVQYTSELGTEPLPDSAFEEGGMGVLWGCCCLACPY